MPQSSDQFLGIFISYRRSDSVGHAGRLYDHLAARFGDGQVFMDVDQIGPGEDFVRVIEDAVGSCAVLLAVIGKDWLTSRDETGRRLDNPNDLVRLELTTALARGVHVIPIFVQEARIPPAQELPEDLRPLLRRNAVELSDLHWRRDVDRLIGALEKIIARQREARRAAQQAEEERRRREAEAQRRQEKAEKQRARAAAEKERREAETRLREDDETAHPANVTTYPDEDDLTHEGADYVLPNRWGNMLLSSFFGGLIAGVPSGIPVVNFLCLVWAIGGGVFAARSYGRRMKGELHSRDGMMLGATVGLIGSLFACGINYLISMSLTDYIRKFTPQAQQSGMSESIVLFIAYMTTTICITVLTTVGALIGVAIYGGRKGAQEESA
jgi:TIR domain-containing protein